VYMSGLECMRLSPLYSSLMGIRVNSDEGGGGGLVGDDAVLVLLTALTLIRDDGDRV